MILIGGQWLRYCGEIGSRCLFVTYSDIVGVKMVTGHEEIDLRT